MKTYTWQTVRRRRLRHNYLMTPAPRSGWVDAVAAIGGIQAQVLSAAELAIAARAPALTRRALQAEIWEQRRLVKTYGPRGTLHLLPAGEVSMWMAAMRARERLLERPWHETVGLRPAQAERLVEAIGDALDGRALTRAELASEAARRAGRWAREPLASTWGELLHPAAYAGRLCFGPSRGSQVIFVRADQWVGSWQALDEEASLLGVLRRYLHAYGPATAADFARWFWLKPAQVEPLLASLSGELTQVTIEGAPAWLPTADLDEGLPRKAGGLRLLPQYDCYLLGSNPREQVVPDAVRERVFSYGRGRFEGAVGLQVIVIDGLVAGLWTQRKRGRSAEIRAEVFEPLSPAGHADLEAEVARLSAFLETDLGLTLGRLE